MKNTFILFVMRSRFCRPTCAKQSFIFQCLSTVLKVITEVDSSSHEWLSNWGMVFMYKHAWWLVWWRSVHVSLFSSSCKIEKKQNKLSVCIGFLLVSNTNRLDAVPSRMGHIHVWYLFRLTLGWDWMCVDIRNR